MRSSSRRNTSITRSVETSASSTISGIAGAMVESEKVAVFIGSELARRHVLQQLLDGRVHHVGERLGIDPHGEDGDREEPEEHELAGVDVLEGRDVVVRDRAV